MTERDWIAKLGEEGYKDVTVCDNEPDTQFPVHTHEQSTVHVIVQGEFTLTEKGHHKTVKVGERINIPAGTTHSAKCGPEGCTFIVGVK
jgi:quercetin dioxygenase-like cupin family protein